MIMVYRVRAECELAHPDWSRISNGYRPPDREDRDAWSADVVQEYIDQHKISVTEQKGGGTRLPDKGIYKKLYDAGIAATMLDTTLTTYESTEMISGEFLSLGSTFLLMIFFLVRIMQMIFSRSSSTLQRRHMSMFSGGPEIIPKGSSPISKSKRTKMITE